MIQPLYSALIEQAIRHPALQPQDVLKWCYQAAYGCEHLISDAEQARACLSDEISLLSATDEPLYEPISDRYLRLNLGAWKKRSFPVEWLLRMFLRTAKESPSEPYAVFQGAVLAAEIAVAENRLPFTEAHWRPELLKYPTDHPIALHHSERYRSREHPHYRVISAKYRNILELLSRTRISDMPFILAIDGPAASGKSTLAQQFQEICSASVVQMDDFFLPPELRTEKRLATPGGNVHYERFETEVLPFLRSGAPFLYQRFDCTLMAYNGHRTVLPEHLIVVEGSYSLHPCFGRYADLTVFLDVPREVQAERIRLRDPSISPLFFTKWIPMEAAYHEAFDVRSSADMVLQGIISSGSLFPGHSV